MDSDDTISEKNGRKLRELAYGRHSPRTLGHVMQVECPGERAGDLTIVDHVKMFRNHPAIHFEFRIHEQVLPSIRQLGGDVQWTDISVVHSGADHSIEGRQRKYERDLRILAEELRVRPEHPFVLFNLGMTHADMENHEAAIDYLRRCVAVSKAEESHLRKAYALLVASLERRERTEVAQEVCRRGLTLFSCDAELLFRLGMLQHSAGKLQEAEATYLELLRERSTEHFSSVDPGIVNYKARHNLGLVYDSMNRTDLAEAQWRNATVKRSQYEPSRRAMVELLIRQGRLQTARVEIERMLADSSLRCNGLILQSLLEESQGDVESAKRWLEDAVKEFPDREEPWQAMCRLLFDHELLAEAEHAIQELLRRNPDDAAAYHNLGVVYMRQEKPNDAIRAFKWSLELRPDAEMTKEQLDAALLALARKE
jgi:tetratricopeptide (TPR) repeat protein